jgi:hypothetical protein
MHNQELVLFYHLPKSPITSLGHVIGGNTKSQGATLMLNFEANRIAPVPRETKWALLSRR